MLSVAHYADVVACEACPVTGKLLRDRGENVPQPGFVGEAYPQTRVLLVGQNPGNPPPHLLERDKEYTQALRDVRDSRSEDGLRRAALVTRRFVPSWPIHGAYFPLEECGLSLDDIAYCNVVRCRTRRNAKPAPTVARTCADKHLAAWLDGLRPGVVVFIGKWPHDQGAHLVRARAIPFDYLNRARHLSGQERQADRERVARLVREVVSGQRDGGALP